MNEPFLTPNLFSSDIEGNFVRCINNETKKIRGPTSPGTRGTYFLLDSLDSLEVLLNFVSLAISLKVFLYDDPGSQNVRLCMK